MNLIDIKDIVGLVKPAIVLDKFRGGIKALHPLYERFSANPQRLVLRGVLFCFIVIGAFIVRNSDSRPSIGWMRVFDLSQFAHISLLELLNFYRNLRIPIPPVIGLSEILSIRFAGSTALVTTYAYRASLVACYLFVIILANTSVKRLFLSFFLSIFFLYVTVIIHRGGPQGYDIFLPLFFLLYLVLLKKAVNSSNKNKVSIWLLPFLSGFFLSMTELSRPFVVYIIPLFIVFAYFRFKKCCLKKQFIVFVIPIILFSGTWHCHLFTAHNQISFSNHSGFNLARAWLQVPVEWVTKNGWGGQMASFWIEVPPVELLTEVHNAPLYDGGWANLNTEEHTENSDRLQSAIFKYWLSNPDDSFFYALNRVDILLSAETNIYDHNPVSRLFGLYKLLVKITSSLMLVNVGMLLFGSMKKNNRFLLDAIFSKSDHLILVFTTYCIFILSIGEGGEEARFLISILPLLAVLPVYDISDINLKNNTFALKSKKECSIEVVKTV